MKVMAHGRVCQVQYHAVGGEFVPHLILQKETK
jgi:hypothetical protein